MTSQAQRGPTEAAGQPATSPPTPEEVRAIVEQRWLEEPGSAWGGPHMYTLRGVIESGTDYLANPARRWGQGDEPSTEPCLWTDLRASEARRLQELVDEAIDRTTARCQVIILEELTAAGVAFAAEHPEAPRPEAPPSLTA